jgi:hypothetical protein
MNLAPIPETPIRPDPPVCKWHERKAALRREAVRLLKSAAIVGCEMALDRLKRPTH